VLDKTIEKTERKKEAKDITNTFGRLDSPSGWDISSNSRSENSARSHPNSKSGHVSGLQHLSLNGSRPSSASGMSSISGNSKDKDKAKYHAKGKESSHPRGRGGGVPIKNVAPPVDKPDRPLTRTGSVRASAADNRPPAVKKWANVMVWSGNGQKPTPYRGFQQVTYSGFLIVVGKTLTVAGL
jgi:hypothetical protein